MATKHRRTAKSERRRVLQLLDAHEENFQELGEWGGHLYVRLRNMVQSGVDLEQEMERPIEQRVMFFRWPDNGVDDIPPPSAA